MKSSFGVVIYCLVILAFSFQSPAAHSRLLERAWNDLVIAEAQKKPHIAPLSGVPDLPEPRTELICPFALAPGHQPLVVDGREIPSKSERSCNFTALTVPGNVAFDHMPRYIREWPGVRKELLTDKFEDHIITFQSAETGVGAWWYWLVRRAVNGKDLATRGFGAGGRPTLAAVARAIAGIERSEEFVRKTYLAPYMAFASEYFGRVVAESEALELSSSDARWNLGRTMFRLESGRTPVVNRKQFDCGIALGNDVNSDFTRAGVEEGSATPVKFESFKGLKFYIENCTGNEREPERRGSRSRDKQPADRQVQEDLHDGSRRDHSDECSQSATGACLQAAHSR
jgi:hypothetical protein